MKRQIVLGVLAVVVLVGLGWLNRYEYFKVGRGDGIQLEFRTNRYTDETDILRNDGWDIVQISAQWTNLHWNKTHPLPYPIPVPTAN